MQYSIFIDYKNRIFGLDVIRALAILLIVFSHSTILLYPNKENIILKSIQFFGTIGVDLFFVLSGFLIGKIILKQLYLGKTRFKDFLYFWIRRWFRTLPNYFLILILNIILIFLYHGEVINEIGYFFVFLQNFNSGQQNFFTESWSLSIEEFAYVIGPLLLYLVVLITKKISKNYAYLIVTLSLVLCVTILRYSFYANNTIGNYDWSRELRKVVIYRIDSIYYGFIGAFILIRFKQKCLRYKGFLFVLASLLFIGIHAIIFLYRLEPQNSPLFFSVFYLPLVSINLLLFFPFAILLNDDSIFKTVITKISVLSYSIYLVNYSIVLLSLQYFIDIPNSSLLIKILVLLLFLILSYGLSVLLYVYFENPMTKLRDHKIIKLRFR